MKKIVVGLLVCIGFVSAFGQKGMHRKAEKCFDRFEFASAAHWYEKILAKHSEDTVAQSRLEQCYQVLNAPEPKIHMATSSTNGTTPANQSKTIVLEQPRIKLK